MVKLSALLPRILPPERSPEIVKLIPPEIVKEAPVSIETEATLAPATSITGCSFPTSGVAGMNTTEDAPGAEPTFQFPVSSQSEATLAEPS